MFKMFKMFKMFRRGFTYGDPVPVSDDVSRIRRMTSQRNTDSLPAEYRRKKVAKLRVKLFHLSY